MTMAAAFESDFAPNQSIEFECCWFVIHTSEITIIYSTQPAIIDNNRITQTAWFSLGIIANVRGKLNRNTFL